MSNSTVELHGVKQAGFQELLQEFWDNATHGVAIDHPGMEQLILQIAKAARLEDQESSADANTLASHEAL